MWLNGKLLGSPTPTGNGLASRVVVEVHKVGTFQVIEAIKQKFGDVATAFDSNDFARNNDVCSVEGKGCCELWCWVVVVGWISHCGLLHMIIVVELIR